MRVGFKDKNGKLTGRVFSGPARLIHKNIQRGHMPTSELPVIASRKQTRKAVVSLADRVSALEAKIAVLLGERT